jgi:hypothetical protein
LSQTLENLKKYALEITFFIFSLGMEIS